VAGVFGALTASKLILYVQALPATLAVVAVQPNEGTNKPLAFSVLLAASGLAAGLGHYVRAREKAEKDKAKAASS